MTDGMLQSLFALFLVLAAAGYLGRRTWRTLRAARKTADAACGAGCGCESNGSKASLPRA